MADAPTEPSETTEAAAEETKEATEVGMNGCPALGPFGWIRLSIIHAAAW